MRKIRTSDDIDLNAFRTEDGERELENRIIRKAASDDPVDRERGLREGLALAEARKARAAAVEEGVKALPFAKSPRETVRSLGHRGLELLAIRQRRFHPEAQSPEAQYAAALSSPEAAPLKRLMTDFPDLTLEELEAERQRVLNGAERLLKRLREARDQ